MRGRQDDEEALFGPRFNLGDFRHLAAGYCRHLIRARLIDEPAFLDQRALDRWGLGDSSRRESLTVDRLLHLAAQDLSLLNREFLPRCHSGGVEPSVTDTPVSRLMLSLAFLVPPTGAAPEFNSTLVELANQARRREPIDWTSVFDAQELTAIRQDLDQLPHPPQAWSTLPDKIAAFRLVLVTGGGRREAYWEGREVTANWVTQNRAWTLLLHLGLAARVGDRRHEPAGESIHRRGARDDLRRLLPETLWSRIEGRRDVFRLDLPAEQICVLRYHTQEFIEEV